MRSGSLLRRFFISAPLMFVPERRCRSRPVWRHACVPGDSDGDDDSLSPCVVLSSYPKISSRAAWPWIASRLMLNPPLATRA